MNGSSLLLSKDEPALQGMDEWFRVYDFWIEVVQAEFEALGFTSQPTSSRA